VEVCVHAKLGHLLAIFRGVRGGYGYDVRPGAAATLADVLQYVPTLLLGEVNVENDDIGARVTRVVVRLVKEANGLISIPDRVAGERKAFGENGPLN
jgi:hypothetical protein